ncbi:MAG: hypothetical protein ACYTF3_06805, partial [Planctomycetota bacterium]
MPPNGSGPDLLSEAGPAKAWRNQPVRLTLRPWGRADSLDLDLEALRGGQQVDAEAVEGAELGEGL